MKYITIPECSSSNSKYHDVSNQEKLKCQNERGIKKGQWNKWNGSGRYKKKKAIKYIEGYIENNDKKIWLLRGIVDTDILRHL